MLRLFAFLIVCFSLTVSADRVEPLLRGWVRHQLAPFNNRAPQWTNSSGFTYEQRTKVGCVATALEEIISYHGRDVLLLDTLPGWKTPNYVVDTLFPGTRVAVSDILPRYDEGNYTAQNAEAVALLSQICGTAARMNYGLEASGADPERLIAPLREAFGWKSAVYLDSYKYAPDDWKALLRRELRAGRPVFYTGYTMNIFGHAFVIDGFDESGRFHFNFGFGGAYDEGWFRLDELSVFEHPDDLTPDGIKQGFFCNQTALLLSPDSVDFHLPDTLVRNASDVRVESVRPLMPPVADVFSPFEITLRNTAAQPLTTPFEFFTNLPSDTLIFHQGDYGALFGATIPPGQSVTTTLHCRFKQSGDRIFRVSPDDKAVVFEMPISVLPHQPDDVRYSAPEVRFLNTSTAEISVTLTNLGTGRSGRMLTFCLMPSSLVINDGDHRHYAYAYLSPGESRRFSARFSQLTPGKTHAFALRSPWTIRAQTLFTLPQNPDGVTSPHMSDADINAPTYDLYGRRVQPDRVGGLFIRNGKKLFLQ